MAQTFKIKKGDVVEVITGKDRGKKGKVLAVHSSRARAVVEGINLYTKHVRPKNANEKGQKVIIPRSLSITNVRVVCPSCGKGGRVGMVVSQGKKERVCKHCGARL